MKIKKIVLTNFRGYRNRTEITFNNLTAFVGKNDAGKSTILEALDLFFNEGKGAVKFDKSDVSVGSESQGYSIEVIFEDFPQEIIVDATYKTTLRGEYLLNDEGYLDIIKKYSSGTKFNGIFIKAKHPTNPNCADLLLKKVTDLRKIIREHDVDCDNQATNSVMRKAIWQKYSDDLQLALVDIDVTDGEDTKKIWGKLSSYLPVYSLFQSDRQNTDGDKEVQDPLKTAVAQFFQDAELQKKLNEVASQVEAKLKEVSNRTLAKLREMDPSVADTLKPNIPTPAQLKWADVFKGSVSITADENIPINKRGSGVKRLVLLNFFRAEAERRLEEGESTGIIYAIEEPETSQHFSNQKILADALTKLSRIPNTQVILTTHSGVFVKMLDFDAIRLIAAKDNGKNVVQIEKSLLLYPSMNEVNYTAFDEITEEYHNELYGFIESQGWLEDYEKEKERIPYLRIKQDGTRRSEERTITHYIRDVMHHPENKNNEKYTDDMLRQSISDMRNYIETKSKITTTAIFDDD